MTEDHWVEDLMKEAACSRQTARAAMDFLRPLYLEWAANIAEFNKDFISAEEIRSEKNCLT